MNYFLAIIFGLVQGATEFLPVSSSGHLVILHSLFNFETADSLTFDITLHFATLLAIVIILRNDLIKIVVDWFKSFRGNKEQGRLGWLVIIATIPAAILGALFEKTFETIFRNPLIVAVMMVVVGLAFIWVEKKSQQTKADQELTYKQSFLIGLSQAIALIPGTSRSGITIITGMANGLKREAAVRFSFLLSIPIILGASIKSLPKVISSAGSEDLAVLGLAFISAFIAALVSVKFLIKISSRIKLNVFAYYRFVVAALVLIYFAMKLV